MALFLDVWFNREVLSEPTALKFDMGTLVVSDMIGWICSYWSVNPCVSFYSGVETVNVG